MPGMNVPLYMLSGNIRIHVGEARINSEKNVVHYVMFDDIQTRLIAIFSAGGMTGIKPDYLIEKNSVNGLFEVTMSDVQQVAIPEPCEHFWISGHEPGHLIYWVRICQFCHKPNWDDLDREIQKLLERNAMPETYGGPQGVDHPIGWDDWGVSQESKSSATVEVDPMDFLGRAKSIVYEYVQSRLEKTDTHVSFGPNDVYIVWFCKTLGNWKACLSTTLPDGMYYEVTHDGIADYDYLDAYKKLENIGVPSGVDPALFLRS